MRRLSIGPRSNFPKMGGLPSLFVQNDPDLLFRRTLPTSCMFDIFDNLLARAFAGAGCLSHVPLLGGKDEQETLLSNHAIWTIGADVRHVLHQNRSVILPISMPR